MSDRKKKATPTPAVSAAPPLVLKRCPNCGWQGSVPPATTKCPKCPAGTLVAAST
jgi:hypothetical protein